MLGVCVAFTSMTDEEKKAWSKKMRNDNYATVARSEWAGEPTGPFSHRT